METVPKSDARISPPDWLARAGAVVWREVVNSLPANYFRPSDEPLLAAYCTSTACYREAAEIVGRDGMILENDRGTKYANPANAMMLAHASSMAQLAVKLRLCPSARYDREKKGVKGIKDGGGERPWDDRKAA